MKPTPEEQHYQFAELEEEMKGNVQNVGAYYDFQAIDFIVHSQIGNLEDLEYYGAGQSLSDSLNQFQLTNRNRAVISLHVALSGEVANHFVGLYVQRIEGGFEVSYIDPTGNQTIPDNVLKAIKDQLGVENKDIVRASNMTQHSQNGAVTNVHCGAYTAEILTGLASGDMRIVDGRLQERVLVGDGENAFVEIKDREEKDSDKYGVWLRKKHLEIMGKDVEDDLGLNKLAELSLVESSPPKTPVKSVVISESPDSSDPEYGAKTLMRKIFNRVDGVKVYEHRIDNVRLPEVTEATIRANPDKYYIANFRGDHLDYFSDHLERRKYVRERVDGTIAKTPSSYQSQALVNIAKKHPDGSPEYDQEVKGLKTPEKLRDNKFVKKYKSSTHFDSSVTDISPIHGNPVISTSKDTKITPKYADHPKTDAKLHPKYDSKKKPKHRLIGMTTVIVHKAVEYIDLPKADIERLRQEGKVGGKSAVERDNQEIMFSNQITSQNIAGYIPLAYPNLSKKYSDDDQKLFGLDKLSAMPQTTRTAPKSLGEGSKKSTIYVVNKEFQWQLAERFVEDKNSNGELLWVDNKGKFRRFVEDDLEKKTVFKTPNSSPSISRTKSSSSEDEIPIKQFSKMDLTKKDGKGK